MFVPARGLGNAHAQTMFAHLARRPRPPGLVREQWTTPDGDVLELDWLQAGVDAPHVLVIHGLEASSQAGYIRLVLAGCAARGWGALAMNFRGALAPNRMPRRYHAGDTGDARFCLGRLRERVTGKLGAVGFSLGGNVLTRLVAEDATATPLAAAVSISAPFDLAACADALDRATGLGAIYRLRFVMQLRRNALAMERRFPGTVDVARVRAARSLRQFDDAFTAPVHGFAGAADYYARASSGPLLERIAIPYLAINADDDPMIPIASVPRQAFTGQRRLEVTRGGGHVGFVAGSPLAPSYWAEARALDFLAEQLS